MDVASGPERGIEGDREVRAPLQDRANQASKLRVGTHFQKGPGTYLVHRLDLSDELDRTSELPREQVSRRDRVIRIGFGGCVRKDGDRRGLEVHRVQGDPERTLGAGNVPAVEGGRDRDRACGDPMIREDSPAAFDLRVRSGQHALLGGILVGDDHIQFMRADQFRDRADRGEHGEHGPRAFHGATRHERPAAIGQRRQGLVIDATGRAKGRQLAETVATNEIGANAEILEDSQ